MCVHEMSQCNEGRGPRTDIHAGGASCSVSVERLEGLTALWHATGAKLQWTCPFVLPPWLSAWRKVLGADIEPLIVVVRQGEAIIGIAPLMLRGRVVQFLGDPSVCDYFDCVVAEGKEEAFFVSLLNYLSSQGIEELDLGPVRPGSSVLKLFTQTELSFGPESECLISGDDVCPEADLPGTWDEYLGRLDGKQRHELRRKLRRLDEAGRIEFKRADDPARIKESIGVFLRLFSMSRQDKATFMTSLMAAFFEELSLALAEAGMLRLFFLEVDGKAAASVFCFDHQGTRYLYNNGYDEAYRSFSVGVMSKVLSLKAAIDDGLGAYNFLKGGEDYKYRMGGTAIPLSRCRVRLGRVGVGGRASCLIRGAGMRS